MKNFNKALITTATILALTACGGSNESVPEEKVPETVTYGPLSTGSVSESVFAYFDLETMTELTLTEEEAASNTVWDIAFKRSSVYLNNASDTPVSAYFTGNNSDFFDSEDIITQISLIRTVRNLKKSKIEYKEKIKNFNEIIKGLENDKELLEKFAREKYLMKKKGENIYLLEE